MKPLNFLRLAAKRLVPVAIGASVLAACSNPEIAVRCPAIRLPLGTEQVTRFAPGAGRDITDVVLQAEVKFLSGECSVGEESIDMTFPVAVRGVRGPADTDGVEQVQVFMAVSTRQREVLARREIPLTLRFVGNRTSIVTADSVSVEIPKTADQDGEDFIVFLGFVLSEEELEYNRTEGRY
ncbi:MAG: hypothetical protein RIM33_00970 [Alphaproteobacteria bacterium]